MRMDAAKGSTSRYWDSRKKRHLTAPTLAELVAELNRQLRADPGYRPGTRFVLRRQGAAEFPGWEGPAEARSLISRVLQSVTRHVALPVPFQIDAAAASEVVDPSHRTP